MKRIISLLLVFALLLPCMGLQAEAATSGSCGKKATWKFDTKTGTLTISGTGAMKDYEPDGMIMPEKAPWSDFADKILEVVISKGVTSIGDYAFEYCFNLKTVTIPDSVSYIGECAFCECTRLTSVTIPDSVTFISDGAFSDCRNLTSITIPDSLLFVNGGAFYCCSSLKDVYYEGSPSQRELISFSVGNEDLDDATWHYGAEDTLLPPTVQIATKAATGKPRLSWDAVEGADFYRVYRSRYKDGDFGYLKSTRSTAFTDTTAETGVNYYYRVKAVVEETGEISLFSNTANRCCDLPRPVAAATVNAASGKPMLTWEAVDGARCYRIYRRTSSTDYTYLDSTTSTAFTDKTAEAGINYFYQVKAVHTNSHANSAHSATVNRACDLPQPVVTVSLKNGAPKITWEKIDGTEKYRVYRADAKDGAFRLVKTTITATGFTDTDVTAGKTYCYKVKALHANSAANSAWSSVKSITAK